jgi:hypothetical protein
MNCRTPYPVVPTPGVLFDGPWSIALGGLTPGAGRGGLLEESEGLGRARFEGGRRAEGSASRGERERLERGPGAGRGLGSYWPPPPPRNPTHAF